MMHPKISIITPSFNQGIYLEETICSVLNQNYPNLEYIIIDGGSTDNSVSIIKKYEKHLNYWISEKDKGQSAAINKGLQHASGEIISWLCSDDVYLDNTLTKIANYFQKHPDTSFVFGKTILFGENRPNKIKGADKKDIELRYFSYIPFPQPSSFFRRKIIDEQGMLNEQLHFGMDFDLLMRIAFNYKILMTDEVFSKYRLHSESKSIAHFNKFLKDWQKIFSKFLRSVQHELKYDEVMKHLGFYFEGKDIYSHKRIFTAKETEKIFLYFLEIQMHMYYHILDLEMAKKILLAIKEIAPGFYAEQSLGKIEWRAKYLPASAIKILRTI